MLVGGQVEEAYLDWLVGWHMLYASLEFIHLLSLHAFDIVRVWVILPIVLIKTIRYTDMAALQKHKEFCRKI